MKWRALVLWLVFTGFLPLQPGFALSYPPPLSAEELMRESDLVALVRVLSVTCLATAKDETGTEHPTGFDARVQLLEVKKGKQAPGALVSIRWMNFPGDPVGAYYPGEEVWTHLTKEEDAYRNTWWNAKGETVKEPDRVALPARLGETLTAQAGK